MLEPPHLVARELGRAPEVDLAHALLAPLLRGLSGHLVSMIGRGGHLWSLRRIGAGAGSRWGLAAAGRRPGEPAPPAGAVRRTRSRPRRRTGRSGRRPRPRGRRSRRG